MANPPARTARAPPATWTASSPPRADAHAPALDQPVVVDGNAPTKPLTHTPPLSGQPHPGRRRPTQPPDLSSSTVHVDGKLPTTTLTHTPPLLRASVPRRSNSLPHPPSLPPRVPPSSQPPYETSPLSSSPSVRPGRQPPPADWLRCAAPNCSLPLCARPPRGWHRWIYKAGCPRRSCGRQAVLRPSVTPTQFPACPPISISVVCELTCHAGAARSPSTHPPSASSSVVSRPVW